MNIKLYYTTAEKNEIGKLEKSELLIEMDNVSFKSSENTYNPTILIKYDPQNIPLFENKLMKANYVYIDILKKYYFITDVVLMTNNIIAYSLKMDVLETYKLSILNLSAHISRCEYVYNPYIEDKLMSYSLDKEVIYMMPQNISQVDKFKTSDISYNILVSFLSNDNTAYSLSEPALDTELGVIGLSASGTLLNTQYACLDWNGALSFVKSAYRGIVLDSSGSEKEKVKLSSFVKSITAYPLELKSYDASTTDLMISDVNVVLSTNVHRLNHISDRYVIADFYAPAPQSYIEYEPYSIYELYLPYYGFTTISMCDMESSVIKIFYSIDYETGDCSVNVYNSTQKRIIFTSPCQLGVKIGLSDTNLQELENQRKAILTNTAINGVGAALSIAGGIATENPLAIAGGVMKGASAIAGAVTSFAALHTSANVSMNSGAQGLAIHQKPFFKITRAKPLFTLEQEAKYAHSYGKPLNAFEKLSSVHGFTQCARVHIEDIARATESEKREIESLLLSGVIIA